MDNFEYLNQISQSTRQPRRTIRQKGLSTALVLKIVGIGVAVFILLMILGGIIGNATSKSLDLTKQIYLRSTNLNTALNDYNRSLKSSKLRAIGVSLSAVLTNTSNQLSGYITTKDKSKEALVPKKEISEQEAEMLTRTNDALNTAKLNGILDRIYDNEIGLQISLLMAQVSEVLAHTKDQDLINILTPFQNSLKTLHDDIEAYTSM